jgi:hypothetical protein
MESISSRNKQKIANLPEQVDITQINTSVIMYNNSKKYSLLSYKENRESIFIQTPLFHGILDIEYFKEYAEFFLQIPKNDDGNNFLTFINELENKIMNLAYSNKSNWFNNQENIKFRSLVKNLEDDDNNKVIKFRIPNVVRARRTFVDSIDNLNSSDSEEINVKLFTQESYIRLIININAIWFTEDTFGLYLRPVYIEEVVPFQYEFQENNNTPLFIDSEFIPVNKSLVKGNNEMNNIMISHSEIIKRNNNINLNTVKPSEVKPSEVKPNDVNTKNHNSHIGRRLNKSNSSKSESINKYESKKNDLSSNDTDESLDLDDLSD